MTWARKHLFNTWYNSLLTVAFGAFGAYAVFRALRFVFVTGRWEIIRRNLELLLIRLFPQDQTWRVWAALFALTIAVTLAARVLRRDADVPAPSIVRRIWPVALLIVVLFALRPQVVAMALVAALAVVAVGSYRLAAAIASARVALGGSVLLVVAAFTILMGFGGVGWDRWGGLLLTMFLATAGILLSFPIGVLLALGRRSTLPVVRAVTTAYIELIRGVPLVALLFMGFFVIGFLVPVGTPRPSGVTRALVAFVMFTSAYLAEVVRGGLQSVPQEQAEAAAAVGLSPISTLRFVVLPQALRSVIPAIVGQFISLFKDTSLVAIIGLTELLHVAQSLTSQRDFSGQQLQAEVLIFASFIYWVGSYTMSRESRRLEQRLGVGVR